MSEEHPPTILDLYMRDPLSLSFTDAEIDILIADIRGRRQSLAIPDAPTAAPKPRKRKIAPPEPTEDLESFLRNMVKG